MKNIYKGKDDLYYSVTIKSDSGQLLLPSDLDAFKIQFYTSPDAYAEFGKDDISEEGILFVDADALQDLPDGPLKARFYIGLADENYADGRFDQVAERLTGYFLKTMKGGNE